jgi:tetratricopeptide (TPR) repeat protein
MSLGANRVAVNLFYEGQIHKSISFHHENLKLSDNENCFAAYYNLGICHRFQGEYENSLNFLDTGLEWARQKGEAESECITLGQLAVTYKAMEFYQKSLEYF